MITAAAAADKAAYMEDHSGSGLGQGPQRPGQTKKNKQKWGVNHEKTCDFTMKNGIQPKKNVYEPTDMMILPTGIWISHIQKPDQRGIQPDKGRIEPGKMGSSPK